MIAPSASSRRAFTLIELLVVISIIAILMTLLFPAVGSAMDAAKKAQAKNDAVQIANAIVAYSTEYGRMPIDGSSDVQDANNNQLWDALMPPNPSNPPDENPRGLVFLEVPIAKNGKNGRRASGSTATGPYLDPWGNPYVISIDGDYDNKVAGPDGDIRKTVLVYSKGKPKGNKQNSDTSKYIKSWE